MLISHSLGVDIGCDFCTSKLSHFIDDPKALPTSGKAAHALMAVYGWGINGRWYFCPSCNR